MYAYLDKYRYLDIYINVYIYIYIYTFNTCLKFQENKCYIKTNIA